MAGADMGIGSGYAAGGASDALQQLLAQRMQAAQFAELQRQHLADEALRQRQIDEQAAYRKMQQDELLRTHKANEGIRQSAEQDRQVGLAHGVDESLPPGRTVTATDPAVGILRTGGLGSSLADKGIPEPQAPPMLAANPNAPPTDLPGTIANAPQPGGRLLTKLPSQKQASDAAAKAEQAAKDKAQQDEQRARDAETVRYHTGMLNKKPAAGEPLVPVRGPDGIVIYMPRSQAAGQAVGNQPGGAQLAVMEAKKGEARNTLDRLDKDIDNAAAKGVIGPGAGRISDLENYIGDPDPARSTLAARFVAAKMQIDAGIGGMRAAGSPMLLKRWDDLLNTHLTPENLHAVTQVMREIVGPSTGGTSAGSSSTSSGGAWTDIGGGLKIRKKG